MDSELRRDILAILIVAGACGAVFYHGFLRYLAEDTGHVEFFLPMIVTAAVLGVGYVIWRVARRIARITEGIPGWIRGGERRKP